MTREIPPPRPWPAQAATRPASTTAGVTPEEHDDRPRGAWTFPPRRLLVPVDFGEASARAVTVGAALAERFGATFTALHAEIVEAPAYFTHEQTSAIERELRAARSLAGRELKQFVQRMTSQPAHLRFVEEPPATAIVEAAQAADLVVMGTHGRRGPSRWWLGSVAERIVRTADRPVLVVRAGREDTPEMLFSRPLMVAGPLAFEGEAARYAAGLAEAFGGKVAEQAAACGEDLARERHATLLVVPGASSVRVGWFGTAAEKLVRSCSLPMLFVPRRR